MQAAQTQELRPWFAGLDRMFGQSQLCQKGPAQSPQRGAPQPPRVRRSAHMDSMPIVGAAERCATRETPTIGAKAVAGTQQRASILPMKPIMKRLLLRPESSRYSL